jgi:2-dehydro-3-deoxyphosphogluconate aldolase/(4S)-4-hydroxy-2-oxoglutarate aldolase
VALLGSGPAHGEATIAARDVPESRTEGSVEETLRRFLDDGVALCIRLGPGAPLVDLCRAAVRGGLTVLEMTLTTPGALDAMATLARDPDTLVGGGTVLTPDDARAVHRAGGRFTLSPVFAPDAIDEATRLGMLAIPGAATPTEILKAHRHGVRLVKVFPSGALGGPQFLRAVRGPFPKIALLPTNGPNADNLADYFDAGAAAVGIMADVFPPGFTIASVESGARKVRQAVAAWRARSRRP